MTSGYDSLTEPMLKYFDYFIKPCFLHFLLMFQPINIRALHTYKAHIQPGNTDTFKVPES